MKILIWSLSTPLVAPTVCVIGVGFAGWLGYRHLVRRVIPRALDNLAGSE